MSEYLPVSVFHCWLIKEVLSPLPVKLYTLLLGAVWVVLILELAEGVIDGVVVVEEELHQYFARAFLQDAHGSAMAAAFCDAVVLAIYFIF